MLLPSTKTVTSPAPSAAMPTMALVPRSIRFMLLPSLSSITRRSCRIGGSHLGHDREEVAVGVGEEGHPLFDAVVVFVDQVGCLLELDAAGGEFVVRRLDVVDAEVDDRRLAGSLGGTEEQAGAAAVEESQVSEGVEVGEPQYVAVERHRFLDVGDRAGDLSNCAQLHHVGASLSL